MYYNKYNTLIYYMKQNIKLKLCEKKLLCERVIYSVMDNQ